MRHARRKRNAIGTAGARQVHAIGQNAFSPFEQHRAASPIDTIFQAKRNVRLEIGSQLNHPRLPDMKIRIVLRHQRVGGNGALKRLRAAHAARYYRIRIDRRPRFTARAIPRIARIRDVRG